jgi:hypothetical protein
MRAHLFFARLATIPNLIYATILRFLPPLPESVQNFLREFGIGGNSLKHVATRAVLWPVWRFSFIAEAGAKQIEGSGRRGRVWFAVKEGSVPGEYRYLLTFSESTI